SDAAIRSRSGAVYSNGTVRNVRVVNSSGYGVYITPLGGNLVNDWTVEDNLFQNLTGSSAVAVRLLGSPGAVIRRNVIDGVGSQGIQLTDGTGAVIEDNVISNIVVDGMNLDR